MKFVEKDEDIGAALKALLKPDADISPSAKDFGFVHRQSADSDIYFIANTSNQKRNVQVTFRVGGAPEVWDALRGRVLAADVRNQTAGSTAVVLNFEPYQSHVVVFSKGMPALPKAVDRFELVASLDLSTDWRVSFGQASPVDMKQIHSWTDDESTRYFSGTAVYDKIFDLPANFVGNGRIVTFDFGEGKALENTGSRNGMQTWYDPPIREAAVIYFNGERVGSLWSPPYRLDVTAPLKRGSNTIRIVVANTALNYMSGRKLPDYKLLTLRYGERFQAQDMDKIQPLTSGLLGPVKLTSIK